MSKKQYNFRLDENMMYKFQYISEEEERTLTQELAFIIKSYIKEYEKSHGEIPTTINIKNSL